MAVPSRPAEAADVPDRQIGHLQADIRLHRAPQQTRVTYWLAPGRRVILLTVFRKTRGAEVAEVARACRPRRDARPSIARPTTRSTARCSH